MAQANAKPWRNRALALIHMAKTRLGLDDGAYVEMLHNVTGKDSCAVMTDAELRLVLERLKSLGYQAQRKPYPGRPRNMDGAGSRAKQLKKIEAFLAEAGRPWSYADYLAKRICRVDSMSWVKTGDLYKVITALRKDAQRHGRE